MKYKRVKTIDFDFSVLGLGSWQAAGGGSWSGHDDKQLTETYLFALENGINFIDTAAVYGYGHCEELVGKVVRDFGRENVFVATKCGLPWNGKKIRNDVSRASILAEIDGSLARLGFDYVDLYQVHWPTFNNVPIEQTIEAMTAIRQSGKARYIGICNHGLADTRRWYESGQLASYQGLYNIIETNAEFFHNTPLPYRTTDEILPFVQETGIAFFPYSPLMQGLLTNRFDNGLTLDRHDVRWSNRNFKGDNLDKIKARIRQLKDEHGGMPINKIALRFLTDNPLVTSVIAGAGSIEQVKDNLEAILQK